MTRPVLKSLLIRDFRSISGEWTIPLDAGVVLVHGPNGAGKTSLLSALELAATGSISYLDRLGDAAYRTHLNYRGTTSGLVSLETVGLSTENSGTATLTAKGAECAPLLDGKMVQVLVERCLLPQATLGRLFEVYAPKDDRGAVTPLRRFVNEILSLDTVDSLIDGLYATGHVARIEKLSRYWKAVERRVEALRESEETAKEARGAAAARVADRRAKLSQLLEIQAENVAADFADQAVTALIESGTKHAEESARSMEALLRLDAIESTLRTEELLNTDPNEPENLSEITSAEARLAEWRSSRSGPLFEWFNTTEGGAAVEAPPDPSIALRELKSQISDLELSLTNARRRLSNLDDLSRRSAEGRVALADRDRRLGELESSKAMASSSSAAAELASVLVGVLEHVDGDECPVCNQQFVPSGTLRQHVISRVESLSQDAAQLLEAEDARARLMSERSALAAQLSDIETQSAQFDRESLTHDVREVAARLTSLKSLEPLGEAGRVAVEEVARLRGAEASSMRRRTLLDECLTDLNQVAVSLQVEPASGLTTQRVAALRGVARAVIDKYAVEQRRLSDVYRLREELSDAIGSLKVEDATLVELRASILALTRQLQKAKRRKEVASDLRKDAERLRTAITTRVFDEKLNGSWSKIFGALVPSEPFVPQFKPIPAGSRRATVEIETVHRDGIEAASPAAMLSHGNLNTAALSLFIALHFEVSTQLPWLIFDDPVQSMDELHIANFASLVKQLTRRNGRQVVIAVHERELFEYLALELTPASLQEEVLTVELQRTYGKSVITWNRMQFSEDTALSPLPAA